MWSTPRPSNTAHCARRVTATSAADRICTDLAGRLRERDLDPPPDHQHGLHVLDATPRPPFSRQRPGHRLREEPRNGTFVVSDGPLGDDLHVTGVAFSINKVHSCNVQNLILPLHMVDRPPRTPATFTATRMQGSHHVLGS